MTNDGWASKWPSEAPSQRSDAATEILKQDSGVTPEMLGIKSVVIGLDKSTDGKIINQGFNDTAVAKAITKLIKENFDTSQLKSQGSNLMDEQAYLYFQCEGCQEILDPNTKSFAKLQEYRVNAGWKCVWNTGGMGYKVYCAGCGEKV